MTLTLNFRSTLDKILKTKKYNNMQVTRGEGPIPVESMFGFIGIDNPDLSKAKDKMFYWYFPSQADPTNG